MKVAWTNTQIKITNWLVAFIAFFIAISVVVAIVSFLMFGDPRYGFPLLRIFMAIYFVHRFKLKPFKPKDDGTI